MPPEDEDIPITSHRGREDTSTDKVMKVIFLVAAVYAAGITTARQIWPADAQAAQRASGDLVQRLERIEAATTQLREFNLELAKHLAVVESQVYDLRERHRGDK